MNNNLSNRSAEEENKENSLDLNIYTTPGYYVCPKEFSLYPEEKANNTDFSQPMELLQSHNFESPIGRLEQSLVAIWQYTLGLNDLIDRKDSFFNLGGSSLNVVQLISRLYKQYQIKLTRADIANHPTLMDQAKLIQRAQQA